jgi:hypothetical protein
MIRRDLQLRSGPQVGPEPRAGPKGPVALKMRLRIIANGFDNPPIASSAVAPRQSLN